MGCVVWLVAVALATAAVILENRNWMDYPKLIPILFWVGILTLCVGSVMVARASRFDANEPWIGRAILVIFLGGFVMLGFTGLGCSLNIR